MYFTFSDFRFYVFKLVYATKPPRFNFSTFFTLIIIVINFYKLNGRVKFYFSVIYRQKTLESPRELFLDPNQFSNDGSMSIGQTQFSKDGSIMAYTVSEKGSDSSAIRVN